jgi:hypothetical protein
MLAMAKECGNWNGAGGREGHFCNTCLAKRTPNSNCLDLVTM